MLPNGNIELNWDRVLDPSGLFTSYTIYNVSGSSSTLVGTIANINQTSFIHTGVSGHNSSFRYIIGTTCSSSVTNFSDTVASIKLTVNNPNNGLAILNWNKIFTPINSPTASNWYRIYQEYPLGTWTLIDSVLYGNEYYRDIITICDDSVNYRVTNSNGTCQSISSVDGSDFKDVLPPNPPVIKNVSVDTNTNLATISWYKGYPLDTRAYIILKFISGSWVPIDTIYGIDNTNYTFSSSIAGTESECYGVAAFDSCWYGTPLSPNTSAMGDSHCSIFLESTYSVCDKTIDLTWNAYSSWNTGVSRYEIFMEVNNGPSNLLATSSSTNYKITSVNPDSNYCFVIKAYSSSNIDTANSNKECFTTTYPFVSDTNYLQTATVVNKNQTQVKIYTPIYNTINGYNIERSTNGSFFNQVAYVRNTSNPIIFNDATVNTDINNYFYRAIAVDSCNNVTLKKTNQAKTILLNATINPGSYSVDLTWNTYKIWDGNVKNYNIFRVLGSNSQILISSISSLDSIFTDDISTFYSSSDDGQFCYFIEAVENINQFGFSETSKSNIVCAAPQELIYVPNAFTPNKNGINDVFLPIIGFANYNTYKLQIFNRLGQLVFESMDINLGWDGKSDNSFVQDGLYIYTVQVETSSGKPITKSGTLILIN